jgi:DMSO/TMAO reductase YedYZ molybdopterin-dependent catalytic subunit
MPSEEITVDIHCVTRWSKLDTAWQGVSVDTLLALAEPVTRVEVVQTLTREQPDGWTGYARRVDAALLGEVAWSPALEPLAFVCGPTSFVETFASGLVALGYPPASVKTERFGAMVGS